jgi:hypothetical protein
MKARRVRAVQDERELDMQAITNMARMLGRCIQKLGPYLMLEILLPGGTLLALLLFLCRSRSTALSPVRVTIRRATWFERLTSTRVAP